MSDKGPSRLEAVFLDLDGSLLNSQRQIGEEDRRTVARLVEAGVRVYISTGRHYELSARYHRELGLTGPFLASDGAVLYDRREEVAEEINEILLHRLKNNIRFCAVCGAALPLHHHGRLCEACYRKQRMR